jgi:hypothetical protein
MITIKATMTTAAMATMETVEAAMITRAFCPALCIENPHRLDDPPVSPRPSRLSVVPASRRAPVREPRPAASPCVGSPFPRSRRPRPRTLTCTSARECPLTWLPKVITY